MTRASRRGFTLVELLISTAVAGFTLSAVMGVFMTQQRSFESAEVARGSQEALRGAMLEMERTLRMAGHGVDPRMTFDFRWFACAAPPCRDKRDGPDEMVFMARNPNYQLTPNGVSGCTNTLGCPRGKAWQITAVSLPTVTVDAVSGETFQKGQVMLFACPGASVYSMGTVASDVTTNGPGPIGIDLAATVVGNPYVENAVTNPCYILPGATAFKIDRYHYFVRTVGGVPYLMLENGLDQDGSGTIDNNDVIPIARGIEDMQISYVLQRSPAFTAPDADTNWIIGDKGGTVEEPDPTLAGPVWNTRLDDALRHTLHPANIRAVRIGLSSRSHREDPNALPVQFADKLLKFENRSVQIAADRFRRSSATTTIYVRNMGSRSPFIF